MAHPAKRKGSQAEAAVRDYLRDNGFPQCERIPAGMVEDRGDLGGIPGWVLQVKSYKDIARALREGVADAEHQRINAGLPYGAAVLKRPGKTDPADWYMVVPLAVGADLMHRCRP